MIVTESVPDAGWNHLDQYVEPTPRSRQRYALISGDSHINEPPDLWTSRLPAKFQERAPRIERFDKGDAWIMEGCTIPLPFGRNACAGLGPYESEPWIFWEQVRPGGYDPAARLLEQDIDGVDAEVMFPTPRVSAAVFANKDPEFHLAMVRAYNDWLSEYCAHAPERLGFAAMLPNRGVADSVAEAERIVTLPGARGFLIGCYPHGGLDMTAEDDPVWAAVTAAGLPLCLHVRLTDAFPNPGPITLREGVTRFLDVPGRIEEFIYGGVLARHPDLRLLFAEVDAGWVPYFWEQADNRWMRNSPKLRIERKMIDRPSTYRDRISFTYITDRYALRNRDLIGVSQILWSSDYPHGASDFPVSQRFIEADFQAIGAEDRHAILAGNAARLFGFHDRSGDGA